MDSYLNLFSSEYFNTFLICPVFKIYTDPFKTKPHPFPHVLGEGRVGEGADHATKRYYKNFQNGFAYFVGPLRPILAKIDY